VDFYEMEKAILDHKYRQGYDLERHYRYACRSNRSLLTLELRLFITLRLLWAIVLGHDLVGCKPS
jgi:hypothetical protein